jgi:hypothetical protein
VHDYLVADLPIAGELHRATARTEVELTRALRVSQFKMQVDAGLTPIDASGQVLGDTLLVVAVRSSTAQVDTHRVRLDGPICFRRSCRSRSRSASAEEGRTDHAARVRSDRAGAAAVHVTIDAESVFVVPDSSVFDAQKSRWTGARRTRCAPGARDRFGDGRVGFRGGSTRRGGSCSRRSCSA